MKAQLTLIKKPSEVKLSDLMPGRFFLRESEDQGLQLWLLVLPNQTNNFVRVMLINEGEGAPVCFETISPHTNVIPVTEIDIKAIYS